MRLTNVGAALNRSRRCPTRCADPVWTKPRGQGGRPTATHHHCYRHCTPQAAHGRCRARNDMAATQRRHRKIVDIHNDLTTEVTARSSYRARALRAGAQEVPRDPIPPEHMQGGSRCPGPAVEPERARWHDPVLGRWLGLTPERLRGCGEGWANHFSVHARKESMSLSVGHMLRN